MDSIKDELSNKLFDKVLEIALNKGIDDFKKRLDEGCNQKILLRCFQEFCEEDFYRDEYGGKGCFIDRDIILNVKSSDISPELDLEALKKNLLPVFKKCITLDVQCEFDRMSECICKKYTEKVKIKIKLFNILDEVRSGNREIDEIKKILKVNSEKMELMNELLNDLSDKIACRNRKVKRKNIEFKKDIIREKKGYIVRKVAPYNIVQEGTISIISNKDEVKYLNNVLIENKRIVLIGEAGSGKSEELKNLKNILDNYSDVKPIFRSLDNYVDETIEELIGDEELSYLCGERVLIFDGYDEIEEKNLNTFARKLNFHTIKNPDEFIIISTRNNFYKTLLNEENRGPFQGFINYSLCPINDKEIYKLLADNEIIPEKFIHQVTKKNLKELLKSPFFLDGLMKLYKNKGRLPFRNEVMYELIMLSFNSDDYKYNTTRDIESLKFDMIKILRKIAFALQCLNKIFLTEEEYQSLFNVRDRNLIKYSGIWCKTRRNIWQFKHNNFREYLAADFLSEMNLEEMVKLVTYKEDNKKVRTSWVNTLSFLVLKDTNNKFTEWLIKNEPFIVARFEDNNIPLKKRGDILCTILDICKSKNIWLDVPIMSVTELATFGQSPKSIEYLISEIKESKNFRALSNALVVIREVKDFFDKELEVRSVLFECISNKSTRVYEVSKCITALINEKLFLKDDIKILIGKFKNEQDPDIRIALYDYILQNNLYENELEFVLNGINICIKRDNRSFGEIDRINSILKKINNYRGIHNVFKSIINNKDIHLFEDIISYSINDIFDNAIYVYNNENKNILKDIQYILIKSTLNFERILSGLSRNFLQKTNNIFTTYELILELDLSNQVNMLYVLEYIMDNDCIDDFFEKYKNRTLEDNGVFIEYVKRLNKGSYRYEELRRAIKEKDNIIIEERECIDFEDIKNRGEKRYFDSLFSKEEFNNLINELVQSYYGYNTKYADLKKYDHDKFRNRYDLKKLTWILKKQDFKDSRVINFLNNINWEKFSIVNIYRELENNEEINIDEKEKKYIYDYCNIIYDINFDEEVTYKKNGNINCSMRLLLCLFFSQKFKIEYDKKIYIKMFNSPIYQFNNDDSYIFLEYIENKFTKEELKELIVKSLENNNIQGDLASVFFKLCKKYKIDKALNLACQIMDDNEYAEWIKSEALMYIMNLKGRDYTLNVIMPKVKGALLELIVSEYLYDNDDRIKLRLIKENKSSDNELAYLDKLILIGCKYGLEKYLDIVKKRRCIPDFNTQYIGYITDNIGKIKSLESLDIIIELAELSCNDNFKDGEYSELRNSTSSAIRNIAQDYPKEVLDALKTVLKKNNINEFTNLCNSNIDQIKDEYYKKLDTALEIDEVKKIISK